MIRKFFYFYFISVLFTLIIIFSLSPCFSKEMKAEKVPPSYIKTIIQPEEIFARMSKTTAGIKDYISNLKIVIHAANLSIPLEAELYFKEPKKTKLILKGIPTFLSQHQNIFLTSTTPGSAQKNYPQSFDIKIIGIRTIRGQSTYLLDMKPKKESNVEKLVMWVNQKNYTVPHLTIKYKNGAFIDINQYYNLFQGYLLISRQIAYFDFPQIKARVEAEYINYKLNQGLSDELFETPEKGS